MIQLHEQGVFLVDGKPQEAGFEPKEEAKKKAIAYSILQAHNKSGDPEKLAPFVAEGLTAADLRRRYSELFKAHKELKAEHESMVAQRPPFGRVRPSDGSQPPPAAPRQAPTDSLGIEDVVTSHLQP